MWKSETSEMEKLFESPKAQTFLIKYILPPGWLLFCGYKLFPLLEYRYQIKPETWLINLAFLGIPFAVFLFIAVRLKHIEVMEERIRVKRKVFEWVWEPKFKLDLPDNVEVIRPLE